MERGLGYVALGTADATVAFLHSTTSTRRPYLWITDRPSERPPDGGAVLRVTPLHEIPGTVDPKRLPDLRAAAVTFIERSGDCLILLDCLECLVLHNGAERVERALADLHDDVAVRNGSLVVFADERTANPRLVAWLQREFDPLPWDPRAVPASVALI